MTKRILFFSISTEMGGAEKSLIELVKSLQSLTSYEPIVITFKNSGPVVEELKADKIQYKPVEAPRFLLQLTRKHYLKSLFILFINLFSFAKYILKLKKNIKQVQPDIIHSAALKGHLLLALIDRKATVIWHFRDIIHSPITRLLLKIFRSKNTIFVCNSKATQDSLKTEHPCKIIYNGISVQNYKSGSSKLLNEKFHISNNAIKVGCIGAFARWKGQLQFIELANYYKRNPNIYFFLVGDQIYDTDSETGIRLEIENKIKTYQLQDKVFICGFQQNIEEYYHSLDLLIHTSIKPEPFGRVLIEAMATKTPIIAANDGGVPEIIQHEQSGFLYQPGSVPQIKYYVDKLVYNNKYKENFIENGYKIFLQKFTLEANLQKITSLYCDILKDNPESSSQG